MTTTTEQQWLTQLQAALVAAGVSTPDADYLASAYPNADPTEFMAGLDWIVELYSTLQVPTAARPTGEPWANIAEQMAQSAPGDIESAFATAIAVESPPLQLALLNALFSRAQYRETQVNNAAKSKTKIAVTSAQLLQFLAKQGYAFRVNETDDSLEVNGALMTDAKQAEIRTCLRDYGYVRHLKAAEDAYLAEAARRGYHPVREYLNGLQWDGDWHIARLAQYFTEKHGVMGLYLRKFMIGSVARAFHGVQNRTLVLEGPQDVGKSTFASRLCPLPEYFSEDRIDPEDKDCEIKAMRTWIWEVKELPAVTARADVNAFKGFLTQRVFSRRPAYGRYEIRKPGLASFIATANDSAGLFNDPTGNRRFMVAAIEKIDWNYTDAEIKGAWAEAVAAFRNGEDWNLTGTEKQEAAQINAEYEMPDPMEGAFWKAYPGSDPADMSTWEATADILAAIYPNNAVAATSRASSMALAATLKKLQFVKRKPKKVWGYHGVKV